MKHFKHLLFLSILCSFVMFTNCGEDSEDPVAEAPTNTTDDDNTDDGTTDPVNYTFPSSILFSFRNIPLNHFNVYLCFFRSK